MTGTDRGTTETEPRSRGTSLIIALLTAAVVVAAGCGGDTGDDTAPSETATTSTAAPATTSGSAATTTSPPATTAPTTTTAPATTTAPSTTTTAPSTTTDPATTAPPTTTAAPPTTTTVPLPEASTLEALIELDRPLVIAHAGGDQDYPHSTLYAYTQSALAGSDILELDVQLTADGVLIVQHDDTVDRTTEASGPVAELTLAEIQALDNAHWFVAGLWGDQTRPVSEYVFRGVRTGEVEPPPGFTPEDFRVATFREVAERFPHHVLDVEIKLQRNEDGEEDPATGIAAAGVLAADIAELGREESVIVASFNDDVLAAFSRLAPTVATTPGEATLVAWFLEGQSLAPEQEVIQLPFTYAGIDVVTPDTVGRIHDEGLEVWVWLSGTDVVETREFYSDLLAMGVDGVLAGRPAEAAAALAEAARDG